MAALPRLVSLLGFGLVLVSPLCAATHGSSPPSSETANRAQESASRATGLVRLLRPDVAEVPSGPELAVELLEAGPDGTASFLRAFERAALALRKSGADVGQLAVVSARIREVPGVVENTLGRTHVPGAMRNDAVAVALEILARDPGPEATARATRLLGRIDHTHAATLRRVAPRLQRFATATLDLRANTTGDLDALVRAALPSLATASLDGVSNARSPQRAAQVLTDTLARPSTLDGVVLNRLERVARRAPLQLDASACAAVRGRLASSDPFLRREAAFACGSIGDREAIAALIQLLDDSTQSVGAAAHTSLKRLTSMTISADAHRWTLWHDRQRAWWDERGRHAVERLATAAPGELVDLVAELSTKRLYRDELALALEDLLGRNDPHVRSLAISALANLRAPRSVPALEALARSGDAELRRQAAEALRALQHAGVEVGPVLGDRTR